MVLFMCYFSSGKFISYAVFALALLSLLAFPLSSPAQTLSTSSSGAGKDLRKSQADAGTAVLPESIDPLPPALPERVRPPLAVLQPARPALSAEPKAALAWRQKALKLSLEKFKAADAASPPNGLLRPFAANYSDTLMALAGSCAQCGFKVEYINSNAGELLALSNDGLTRLIFSIWEQAPGKTWISAGIDRGAAGAATKSILLLLDTTGATVSKRGRI